MTARLVVLASGEGTNLQALIDACASPGYGAEVMAVGTDRHGIASFVLRVRDFPDRESWDKSLTTQVAAHEPDLVVLAGFMKLVGEPFLSRFGGRCVNTHPALLPSFPGMHGARDALDYGVKVSGCTVFVVDEGVDAGPIVGQACVPVLDDDDEKALHERIKVAERVLLVDTVGKMVRHGWTIEGRKVRFGS